MMYTKPDCAAMAAISLVLGAMPSAVPQAEDTAPVLVLAYWLVQPPTCTTSNWVTPAVPLAYKALILEARRATFFAC